jgi:hypothetical protein
VYWAHTRLIEHLIAADAALANACGADGVAAYHRRRNAVVVGSDGSDGSVTIEPISERPIKPPHLRGVTARNPI